MPYKVVKRFFDLVENHAYSVGDAFPHNGVEVASNRIEELLSNSNRLGVPLIEEIPGKPRRARKKKNTE